MAKNLVMGERTLAILGWIASATAVAMYSPISIRFALVWTGRRDR